MVAAVIDLIQGSQLGNDQVDLQVEQGATYEYPFAYSGDLTTGTFNGEVRTDYKENNGTVLATFVFSDILFVPGNPTADPPIPDLTQGLATLLSSETDLIPATFNVPDTGRNAINQGYYVYDIEYTRVTGEIDRKQEGLVQVTPQSTD